MLRKRLKGLIKTRHFVERQKERKVSDKDVIRAICEGHFVRNEHGQNYVLGNLKVTVDFDHELLVTVHPGDLCSKTTKILTKEEAKKLKDFIDSHRKRPETDLEKDEFKKYVEENRIRKLK
jgi:hypothetical protein